MRTELQKIDTEVESEGENWAASHGASLGGCRAGRREGGCEALTREEGGANRAAVARGPGASPAGLGWVGAPRQLARLGCGARPRPHTYGLTCTRPHMRACT